MAEVARQVDDAAGDGADKRWISMAQAAEALGLTASRCRQMCRSGELVARKGRRRADGWRVDAAALPPLALAAGLDVVALATDPLAGLSAARRAGIQRRLAIVREYRRAMTRRDGAQGAGVFRRLWVAGYNIRHRGHLPAGQAGADSGHKPLSVRTLTRWDKSFRDRGVAGLVYQWRYVGTAACDERAWEMFAGLYLDEARPSMAMMYEIVAAHAAAEGWAWPTLRTVRRWAAKRLDPKVKALGRDPRTYRDRCEAYIERDATKIHANQVWVGDHRLVDVLIPHYDPPRGRKPGRWLWWRPWVTVYLDWRTWYPVARRVAFESPTGQRVMECFVAGIERHGQPAATYLDNGKDFRMYRFAGGRKKVARKGDKVVAETRVQPMLDLLGIESHWALPYNAKAKIVEPWFGIMSARFDRTWPTYIGNKAANKPERMQRRAWAKQFKGKAGEYHAQGYTIEAFAAAFERWIDADYALRTSPSSACNGLSVARAFAELRPAGYTPVKPAASTLALLLMPSVAVRVEANGIWVKSFGRHYWSDELEGRRCGSGRDEARKVRYRYREDDPSVIYVFDARTDAYLCAATPYIGSQIHPVAAHGSADAERLEAAMALKRRLARADRDEVARLRKAATVPLLAAAQAAGGTLGLHDDPQTIPAPPAPVLRLVAPADAAGLDAAGVAAGRVPGRRDSAAAELIATGTDEYTSDSADVGTSTPSALDLLSQSESGALPDGSRLSTPPGVPRSRDPTGSARVPARRDEEPHDEHEHAKRPPQTQTQNTP